MEKCFDSILGQSISNFELIIVDDGSTDASPEICDKYKGMDSRVKVIHKKNGGLSTARNTGLDVAQGDYIAFVDSDDWVKLDMFEILYHNLLKSKAEISQCGLIKTRREEELSFTEKSEIDAKVYSNMEHLNELHKKHAIVYGVVWNKLYKKELFHNIRFPEGKIHEDEFVNYRLIYKAKSIVYTTQKMYYYRQRTDSIIGKKFNLSRLDSMEAYLERAEFYKKIKNAKLYQKELLFLLKHIIWLYSQVEQKVKNNKKELRQLKIQYRKVLISLLKSKYKGTDLLAYAAYVINKDLYIILEKSLLRK